MGRIVSRSCRRLENGARKTISSIRIRDGGISGGGIIVTEEGTNEGIRTYNFIEWNGNLKTRTSAANGKRKPMPRSRNICNETCLWFKRSRLSRSDCGTAEIYKYCDDMYS